LYGTKGRSKKKNQPLYNLSKFTVWCVRVSHSELTADNKHIKNLESGPCIICKQRLSHLGFGKIAFSNIKGEIEIHKLKDYNKVHIINNHRRFIKQKKCNCIKDINAALDFIKLF
jgi:hypothetical protein